MSTLIEKSERESDRLHKLSVDFSHDTRLRLINEALGIYRATNIVKKHQAKSDWIDISVEPIKRTEFDSEVVLAIDVNGYTYNVALADVVISGETKREWTECKAKWNGEFWEAVEYICRSEKVVAYKHIPKPPSEVKP